MEKEVGVKPMRRTATALFVSLCWVSWGGPATAEQPPFGRAPAEMVPLRSMEGSWTMLTLEPDDESNWRQTLQSAVRVTSILSSHMIEMEGEFSFGKGIATTVRFVWSFDQFHQVYRIAVLDAGYGFMDILDGRFDSGRLVATNLKTGTATTDAAGTAHFVRLVLDLEGADHFTLSSFISTDRGETWTPFSRMKLSRERKALATPRPVGR